MADTEDARLPHVDSVPASPRRRRSRAVASSEPAEAIEASATAPSRRRRTPRAGPRATADATAMVESAPAAPPAAATDVAASALGAPEADGPTAGTDAAGAPAAGPSRAARPRSRVPRAAEAPPSPRRGRKSAGEAAALAVEAAAPPRGAPDSAGEEDATVAEPVASPPARSRRGRRVTRTGSGNGAVAVPPAMEASAPSQAAAPPPEEGATTAARPLAAPEPVAVPEPTDRPAEEAKPAATASGVEEAPRRLVRSARPQRRSAPMPAAPRLDELDEPEAHEVVERGRGQATGRRRGPTADPNALAEPRTSRSSGRRLPAEPERRRGPIVDPRRRPSPDEQAARSARPSRRYPSLGTIRELKPNGYGFLEDSAGRRRFFHRSEVVGIRFDQLRTGQKVQFDPSEDVRGLRALQVRPAPAPRPATRGRGGERRGARLDYEGWSSRPRRLPDEGQSSRAPWRSSLSPFRGEPPSGPPRRKR